MFYIDILLRRFKFTFFVINLKRNKKISLDWIYYDFRGKSMTLLKSYLSNRSQITKLGKNSSSKLNINIGVPQGSILRPILFILYINYVHNCLDISDDNFFLMIHLLAFVKIII